MHYIGSFINKSGDTIEVEIVTGGDRTLRVEIGEEGSGLYFPAEDAARITSSVNDSFDVMLRSSASIRLLTREFRPDLFRSSPLDAVVNIRRNGECVFAGYVEPRTYSQLYNELYDELEINCIDALSALQFIPYRNCGTSAGLSFDALRSSAGQRTFKDIVSEVLGSVSSGLDLAHPAATPPIHFDCSKALASTAAGGDTSVFSSVAVAEMLFIGKSEEDVWTQDRVLEAILRYLNLHIAQEGASYRIFTWETVRATTPVTWVNLLTGATSAMTRATSAITSSLVADASASISIAETYNQIALTCRVEGVESIIESPLDSSSLTSPYARPQKYMEELAADGRGETAINGFKELIRDGYTTCGLASRVAWYMQAQQSKNWCFPLHPLTDDAMAYYCAEGKQQESLPLQLGVMQGAGLFAFGKVELDKANPNDFFATDGKVINKLDLTPYLAISVNGNGDLSSPSPTPEMLKAACPRAVYTGPSSGVVLSPADSQSTNYIVISGALRLQRRAQLTASCQELKNTLSEDWTSRTYRYWGKTVPSKNNKDGRYYTLKHFAAPTPFDAPTYFAPAQTGTLPPIDSIPSGFSTKGSKVGGVGSSKVPILLCMLSVGDKCVVEEGGELVWRPYKERSACPDDASYYSQCFSVGVDTPKGEFLVGEDMEICNTLGFVSQIDAQGTAIPIKASDKLSGAVRFSILGPVNMWWTQAGEIGIVASNPSFDPPANLGAGWEPVLANVASVLVKDFEVKVYSDNGMVNSTTDNDLVYISDAQTSFTNKKEGITFDINSALTSEEYHALGLTETVKLSTPLNTATGSPLRTVYDRNLRTDGKPEQFYVDAYYKEYSVPRVVLTQNLRDDGVAITPFRHYTHPALSKTMYPLGISRNLHAGEAELTLKEI